MCFRVKAQRIIEHRIIDTKITSIEERGARNEGKKEVIQVIAITILLKKISFDLESFHKSGVKFHSVGDVFIFSDNVLICSSDNLFIL